MRMRNMCNRAYEPGAKEHENESERAGERVQESALKEHEL